MIEERPLARLIRLHRYEELDEAVDEIIHEHGWSEVLNELRDVPTFTLGVETLDRLLTPPRPGYQRPSYMEPPLPPPYHITEDVLASRRWLFSSEDIGWGVREGTLRDGIVHILGLQIVQGIDIQFGIKHHYGYRYPDLSSCLEPFEDIQASSLDELRQGAIPVGLDVLRSQAAEHRTFFLDVDAMTLSPFAPVVPDIIEARKSEVQALNKDSKAREVVETYYGFRVLTEGSISNTGARGFDSSSREALDEMAQALGGDTNLSHTTFESWRRTSYVRTKETWKGYDELTRHLLEAIVQVSAGGRKTGIPRGLRTLGALGDSRALPILHRLLELIPIRSDRLYMVLDAIGKVGHPSSFDHILPWAKKKTVAGTRALEQMALIRSSRATDHLIEVLNDLPDWSAVTWRTRYSYLGLQQLVAGRLWMTFDSRAVDALLNASKRVLEVPATLESEHGDDLLRTARISRLGRLATISLAFIGEEGQAVLRKHPEIVARVILNELIDTEKLLKTLGGVKGLMDDPVIVKAVQELETRETPFTRWLAKQREKEENMDSTDESTDT